MIDKMGSIPVSDSVVVHLAARSTWPRVSHFPEVILHAAWKNPTFRQTAKKEMASDARNSTSYRFLEQATYEPFELFDLPR